MFGDFIQENIQVKLVLRNHHVEQVPTLLARRENKMFWSPAQRNIAASFIFLLKFVMNLQIISTP